MKTNYVLIDFENVQVKSLALLKGEEFQVKVFLGPNNKDVPLDLVLAIQKMKERGDYIVLDTPGKNALDFHLTYYLGVLATTDPHGFFHIISKDKGYDSLIRHLLAKKIFCKRSEAIELMPCFHTAPLAHGVPATPPESAPKKQNIEALTNTALTDLLKRKTSKPRTKQTLLNTIHSTCGKQLPLPEIDKILALLVKKGLVKINDTKVTYNLPAE